MKLFEVLGRQATRAPAVAALAKRLGEVTSVKPDDIVTSTVLR